MSTPATGAAGSIIGTQRSGGKAERPLDLHQIQGNIIGFNKPYQSFLFLRFPVGWQAEVCSWLCDVIPRVATAAQVLAFNNAFKALRAQQQGLENTISATWLNLAFTHAGLAALGTLPCDDFPAEFRQGMRLRAEKVPELGDVGDGAPDKWVFPNDRGPIHALLLLAADNPDDLRAEAGRQITALTMAGIHLLFKQDGMDRPEQRGHEHFGFKDGVSQPGIRDDRVTPRNWHQAEDDRIAPGEFVIGYSREGGDMVAPKPAWTKNGSYVVFRRLRQDVGGFRTFIRETARNLHITTDLMAAKLVGRYYSGAPLAAYGTLGDHSSVARELGHRGAPSPVRLELLLRNSTIVRSHLRLAARGIRTLLHARAAGILFVTLKPSLGQDAYEPPDDGSGVLGRRYDPGLGCCANDFDYRGDDIGRVVPLAAHIRKVNPRDQGIPPPNVVRRKRIIRRGIPFGQSYSAAHADKEPPGGPAFPNDRGLLFICYQSSIAEQFEFLQRQWSNNPKFPSGREDDPGGKGHGQPGHDPIIGQTARGQAHDPREFSLPGSPRGHIKPMAQWVTTTGGDYFFSPSIDALRQLANHQGKEREPMQNYPDFLEQPIPIENKGAALCTVQISVAISDLLDQVTKDTDQYKKGLLRLKWVVAVGPERVWESSGYEDLKVTSQGVVTGRAEISVRQILRALVAEDSELKVQTILERTDTNNSNGNPAAAYRRMRILVKLPNKDWISLPVDMGVGGNP